MADGEVPPSERRGAAFVEARQDYAAMTSIPLSKADWRKLAFAATGSIFIGAGAFLSPLIPIGAVAVGAVFVVVAGLRGTRH